MHANWMHDISVGYALNDQKNEINFLNSQFQFRMFREQIHTNTDSSELEQVSRARMLPLHVECSILKFRNVEFKILIPHYASFDTTFIKLLVY